MCAAFGGHAHVVETLLQHGAKVDMTTEVSAFTATTTEVPMKISFVVCGHANSPH